MSLGLLAMCSAPPVQPQYSVFSTLSPPDMEKEDTAGYGTRPSSGPGLGYATSEVWEQYKKQLQVCNSPTPTSHFNAQGGQLPCLCLPRGYLLKQPSEDLPNAFKNQNRCG